MKHTLLSPTHMRPDTAGTHDARLIVASRGVRQFAYGLLAVVLGVSLKNDGLPTTAIGALITVSLIGDFADTYAIGLFADRWGRRRTLAGLAILMAATGAVFGLVRAYPLLLVASLAGALGALAAALPEALARVGVAQATGLRLTFGVYALAALVVTLLVTRLSPRVEPADVAGAAGAAGVTSARRRLVPPLGRSRRVVLTLSALFSLDAFAGGFVVQSLMALFFYLRFGVPLATLAALFFAANLITALSFLAVAPIARRIGLLNTMVFTHLPSNVLLALVPLMPAFPVAAGVLLLRQTLSQMDVPSRQAYTMALVAPEERTAAASVTSLARSAGSASSPVVSGVLLQPALLALGLP
ncbi:MAG TPA: MFS transporter, partial [Ktedonobacterales bacterium]|nr:MFS transporter [Ktedonobacterales bacterium]